MQPSQNSGQISASQPCNTLSDRNKTENSMRTSTDRSFPPSEVFAPDLRTFSHIKCLGHRNSVTVGSSAACFFEGYNQNEV